MTNDNMGAKTSEHIIRTVSTLKGLLDFVALGDTLSEDAILSLSLLNQKLKDLEKTTGRSLEIDVSKFL